MSCVHSYVVELVLCALTLKFNWIEHAHTEFTSCYRNTIKPRPKSSWYSVDLCDLASDNMVSAGISDIL